MFLLLVASLLALLSYRKTIFDAHKSAIYEEATNLPSVIVKNVSISYDERLNYSLIDDISLCTGCSVISVTFDDYEIERDDYDKFLRTLTYGDYMFVYKVTNGKSLVTRIRKITITL